MSILKTLFLLFVLITPNIATANIQQNEIHCLAQAMFQEAKGEGLIGKAAVAMVVINRKKDSTFPSNICDIISQPGQFPWYRRVGKGKPPKKYIQNAEIIFDVYYTKNMVPCDKLKKLVEATYFNTVKVPGTVKVDKIGGHLFSK